MRVDAPMCDTVIRNCYQESPQFAHAQGFELKRLGLENAAENINCPDMNGIFPVYDVAVVGGGPSGLTAAIAIAQAGANTALIARRSLYADNRTTALLG
jgi:heterodisulfide reductase subunit A-like polyferredoxin